MTSVSDLMRSSLSPGSTMATSGTSSDDTKSRIGDEYVLVRKVTPAKCNLAKSLGFSEVGTSGPLSAIDAKTSATDVSSAVMPASLAGAIMSRHSRAGSLLRGLGTKGVGGQHFMTRVFSSSAVSSGVGAALAVALSISPSSSPEWSSFQALFDDYKVISAATRYLFTQSGAPVAATSPWYAVCYDATYGSAPTSVAACMESDRFQVGALSVGGNFPSSVTPAGTKDGVRHFKYAMPKAPIISPVAVTGGTGIVANLPGSWIDMGDAQSTSAGYLKLYCELSAASTITVRQITEFVVIFRQRT